MKELAGFPQNIYAACSGLNGAAAQAAPCLDGSKAADILELTWELPPILEEAEPDLKFLQKKVEYYAKNLEYAGSISGDM